jgi:hypothetical protein
MGGTTQQVQQQQSTTQPWAPAQGVLGSILGQLGAINPNLTGAEQGALSDWLARAQAGNPYAGAIGNVANTLLAGGGADRTGMINEAYANYRKALDPFASGAYVDPSQNPALQKYLDVARNDAANSVNSQFAAAGRDLSGMNTQALGRGISQAEAPILYAAYNQARGQQLGAINSLYNAGNSTGGILAGLDQQRLANMQAGIGAAGSALDAGNWSTMQTLAAEAARRGIPLQTLAQMSGIALPIGQAFGTKGETTTTQTNVPWWQQALGYGALAAGMFGKFK